MNFLTPLFGWLRSRLRENEVDKRERVKILASELEKLAELMTEVLKSTDTLGRIQSDKLVDLEMKRKRVWDRWVSILSSSGYARHDADLQTEIEKCIRIAHAAPGAYVEEVYLAQIGISEGIVSLETRQRFEKCVHRLQDLITRMRLNA